MKFCTFFFPFSFKFLPLLSQPPQTQKPFIFPVSRIFTVLNVQLKDFLLSRFTNIDVYQLYPYRLTLVNTASGIIMKENKNHPNSIPGQELPSYPRPFRPTSCRTEPEHHL